MQDFLHVKVGRDIYQVFFSQLQYIESRHKYLRVVTTDRVYVTRDSLSKIASKLPVDQFCRIHRSFIVSFRYARQLNNRNVIVAGMQLPVGRQYRGMLLSKIIIKRNSVLFTRNTIDNLFNKASKT